MAEFVMGARLELNNDFSNPMNAATNSTEEFKNTTEATRQAVQQLNTETSKFSSTANAARSATAGLSGQTQAFSDAVRSADTAVDNVTASTQQAAQGVNQWKAAIQQFNRGAETLKALPGTIKQIAAQKLDGLKNSIVSTRLQAAVLTGALQTVAKTKITGAINGFKEFKATVTEGKSGLSGFATGLKNIGKISIAKTVDAVKQFKPNFAAAKSAASGLWSAVKNVASTSLSALHTGIKKVGTLAKEAGSAVLSGLGNAVKSVAKGLAVGAGAAATAVGALVAKSVSAFADYEQLVGGVETLFKGSAGIVQQYANNAFKTAGLSANAYMETVTGFSASLLQSVGGDTEKAAHFADMAISDMADNANKMGTGMESIQNAYQGFAKQNYTMLDNLKLGYGGTKEEMQRLLSDAEKLTGKKFDLSSYSDLVQAIHAVQENMDITGTTAKEAEFTISGSAASMKAAWGNMLVSLTTGGEDFDVAIDNLVSTAKTFGSNIIPAVSRALGGVGKLIENLAPMIANEIPTLVSSLLPQLINAGTSIVENLVTGIESNLDALTSGASQALTTFVTGIVKLLPRVLTAGIDILMRLAQGIIAELPQMLDTAAQAIASFLNGVTQRLPDIIQMALQLVQTVVQGLINNLPMIIQAGITLIVSLLQGIINMLPALIQAALQLIMALVQGLIANLPLIINAAVQLITSLIQGLVSMLPAIIQAAIQLILTLVQAILNNLPTIIQAAVQIVVALAVGLIQAIPQLIAAIPQLISAIVDTILNTNWLDVGWQIVKGIGKGLWDGVKSLFGGGKDNGKAVADGTVAGIDTNLSAISTASTTAANTLTTGFQPDYSVISGYGSTAATSLADGVAANTGTAITAASDLATQVSSAGSAELTFKVGAADTSAMDDFKTTVDTSAASVKTTLSTLETDVTNSFTAITKTFKDNTDAIKKAVAACNLYDSGIAIMRGLNNGINSMRATLMATAHSIASSIGTEINSALKIHSPSKVTEASGEDTGEGLVIGIRKMIDKVRAAAYDLSDSTMAPFSTQSVAPAAISTTSTPTASTSGRGGLWVTIEKMILENVGDKDPKQLVAEILQMLYDKLADADDVLSTGEMGALL